jgi:hypothetical protein
MLSTTVMIFSGSCFQKAMGKNSLSMQTMQNLTQLESVELFASKTRCGSPYSHRPGLISHHPTFLSSDMSSVVYSMDSHKHVYMVEGRLKNLEPIRQELGAPERRSSHLPRATP